MTHIIVQMFEIVGAILAVAMVFSLFIFLFFVVLFTVHDMRDTNDIRKLNELYYMENEDDIDESSTDL